jgi:uncharacterized iron-regulated protein
MAKRIAWRMAAVMIAATLGVPASSWAQPVPVPADPREIERVASELKEQPQPLLVGQARRSVVEDGKPALKDITLRELADELHAAAQGGAILLLGEVHDNATVHRMRGALIRDIAVGVKPALVFEHIRTDQQAGLDAFAAFNEKARRLGTVDDLLRFIAWDKSGWPPGAIFKPIFSAALAAKLPIYPGDVPKDRTRDVARGGIDKISPDERARLKLDQPFDETLQDALLTELEGSHCGMMQKSHFGNMAMAQRYRDANLAEATAKAAEANGSAILIAGNGHVRTDRAAPFYLRQMAPGRKIIAVMALEVQDGQTDATAGVPRDPDGRFAADFVIFAPRTERPDPCTAMREKFGKKS